jgi:hypothetical protein
MHLEEEISPPEMAESIRSFIFWLTYLVANALSALEPPSSYL